MATFTEADFPHTVLLKDHPEVVERCKAVDEAFLWLDALKSGVVPQTLLEEADLHIIKLKHMLTDPHQFTAGGLTRYYHVWQYILGRYARDRRNVKWLLSSIRHGVKWDFATSQNKQTRLTIKKRLRRSGT